LAGLHGGIEHGVAQFRTLGRTKMNQSQHSQFGVELGLLITCSISAVVMMAAVANYFYTDNYYGAQVPNEGGAGFSANLFLLLLSIATVISSVIMT